MSDQIESAAAVMTRDYIILAFLVSLGALQIAVSISGIRGLWLTPNHIITRALGIILIAIGLGYYIFSPLWLEGPWAAASVIDGTSEDRVWGTAAFSELSAARNLNDIHGGMAGTAYAGFFVLSAVLATLFASVIGAINLWIFRPTLSRSSKGSSQNSMVSPAQREKCSKPAPYPDTGDKEGHHGMHPLEGLDALKNTDALNAFTSSLLHLRRTGRDDIRNYLRSAHRWSIPSMIGRMRRN